MAKRIKDKNSPTFRPTTSYSKRLREELKEAGYRAPEETSSYTGSTGQEYIATQGDSWLRRRQLETYKGVDGRVGKLSETMESSVDVDDYTGATPAQEKAIETLRTVLASEGLSSAQRQEYGSALGKLMSKVSPTEEPSLGNTYGEDMSTAAVLQLERIGHMEPRIQAGIKATLEGGRSGDIGTDAAIERFSSIIGLDPVEFAKQINIPEGTELPRAKEDIATVKSMLGNTAGTYMDRGPGSTLPGNYLDPTAQSEADVNLKTALSYVDELADLYIDGRTRGSRVEDARRLAVTESLTKRLMDGTFYEGASSLLPLPNETGVVGLKPTMSYRGYTGTAYTRTEFAGEFGELATRDKEGKVTFKEGVSEAQQQEYWENAPNLKGTLFPRPRAAGKQKFTEEEVAKHKRDQDYALSQAYYKAEFARKILREQMPSTRDESKGQIRMVGFDTPYGEQAEIASLRNEAAEIGLDWTSSDDPDTVGTVDTMGSEWQLSQQKEAEDRGEKYVLSRNVGSDQSGAYGYRQLSEVDLYVEARQEIAEEPTSQPRQGTPEWLAQRRGKVTASKLIDSSGKRRSSEEIALELGKEALGYANFRGNAHTREGNEGEEIAKRAFLAGPGKGLVAEEAFFESHPIHKGIGASPDGKLYNQDGESEGLLELKFLTSGAMKKALDKYTPQMQQQMAVTGESKTHFFAMDKYTGETIHEVVHADPEMQEDIINTNLDALELAKDITVSGLDDLETKIAKSKKQARPPAKSASGSGQTSSYERREEVQQPMTAYRATGKATSGPTGAAGTLLAQEMQKQEDKHQRELAKEALLDASIDAADATDESAEANRELEDAAKAAADQLKEFQSAVGKTSGILSELGSLITGTNKEAMEDERIGALSGMEGAEVRGVRRLLQERTVMTEAETQAAILSAGRQVQKFAESPESVESFLVSATKAIKRPGASEALRSVNLPDAREVLNLSSTEWLETQANLVGSLADPQDRKILAAALGNPEIAMIEDVTGSEIAGAYDQAYADKRQRLLETKGGIEAVRQVEQEAKELTQQGETVGMLGRASESAGAVLSSNTATALISAAGGTAIGATVLGKGAAGATAVKGLAVAGAVPTAAVLAAGATGAAIGTAAYGSIRDTSFGESLSNTIGTSIDTVRAALGNEEAKERLEMFKSLKDIDAASSEVLRVGTSGAAKTYGISEGRDISNVKAKPLSDIGTIEAIPLTTIDPEKLASVPVTPVPQKATIENIELNVSVDPDMVKSEVEVDGRVYMDQETGYS